MEKLFSLSLASVEVLHIGLETLEDFNLHEFLETLYVLRFGFKLHVGLLGDNQVVLRKLLLVGV